VERMSGLRAYGSILTYFYFYLDYRPFLYRDRARRLKIIYIKIISYLLKLELIANIISLVFGE